MNSRTQIRSGALGACAVICTIGAIQQAGSQAPSQHIRDHNLRGFISGQTLHGRTTKDNESWSITFHEDGSFKIIFTNGRVGRGRWSVQGPKIHLLFDRSFPDMCRTIFLAADGGQEWQDCRTGHVSSRIVSPIFDRQGPNLNEEKAEQLRRAAVIFRQIAMGLPIQNNPAAESLVAAAEQTLTREAQRLLSAEGRRRHAAAAVETLYSGRPSRWENPAEREEGEYRVLAEFQNSRGHACKRVLSTVIVKGEKKQEEQVQCVDETGKPYAVG